MLQAHSDSDRSYGDAIPLTLPPSLQRAIETPYAVDPNEQVDATVGRILNTMIDKVGAKEARIVSEALRSGHVDPLASMRQRHEKVRLTRQRRQEQYGRAKQRKQEEKDKQVLAKRLLAEELAAQKLAAENENRLIEAEANRIRAQRKRQHDIKREALSLLENEQRQEAPPRKNYVRNYKASGVVLQQLDAVDTSPGYQSGVFPKGRVRPSSRSESRAARREWPQSSPTGSPVGSPRQPRSRQAPAGSPAHTSHHPTAHAAATPNHTGHAAHAHGGFHASFPEARRPSTGRTSTLSPHGSPGLSRVSLPAPPVALVTGAAGSSPPLVHVHNGALHAQTVSKRCCRVCMQRLGRFSPALWRLWASVLTRARPTPCVPLFWARRLRFRSPESAGLVLPTPPDPNRQQNKPHATRRAQ